MDIVFRPQTVRQSSSTAERSLVCFPGVVYAIPEVWRRRLMPKQSSLHEHNRWEVRWIQSIASRRIAVADQVFRHGRVSQVLCLHSDCPRNSSASTVSAMCHGLRRLKLGNESLGFDAISCIKTSLRPIGLGVCLHKEMMGERW